MKLRTAGWLGLATLLPACIYTNSWSYSPAPRRPGPPLLDRTLVVLPLEDQRGTEVSLGGGLALIPFFIYGTNSWQRFEQGPAGGGGGSDSVAQRVVRPPVDFALAIAQEVDNARLFREAFLGAGRGEADYALQGRIVDAGVEVRSMMWGLSILGAIIDCLGAPMWNTRQAVELHLTMQDSRSGAVIWEHDLREEDSNWTWIYAIELESAHDQLLETGMAKALESLRAALAKEGA